jgi:ligand-binding SRPBCC domain-containing protein
MEYTSHFKVNAPIDSVRGFHLSAQSLRAITPPLIPMTSLNAPDVLSEGAQLGFTLWLGPMPVRWVARIEDMHEAGFVDRQISGPFAVWSHQHEFKVLDQNHTRVDDRVTYRLKSHPFWWLVGGLFVIGLPLLFRFRAYKTIKLLERK